MYQQQQSGNNSSSSLAIVSSVLFPHVYSEEGSCNIKRRKVNLQSIPGAWIDNKEDEVIVIEEFKKTVSSVPPRLSLLLVENNNDQDVELLKKTIENLRKEKEKLEETNDIVKKSIQIVARKRMIAQTNTIQKKANKKDNNDEDVYIIVSSDFIPTQDEMKAAGLDGWEWISAY